MDPSDHLEIVAVLPESVGFYLTLMVIGFMVGGYGHMMKSKLVVATGITLIFLATVLLPIFANILDAAPPPPGPNIQGP